MMTRISRTGRHRESHGLLSFTDNSNDPPLSPQEAEEAEAEEEEAEEEEEEEEEATRTERSTDFFINHRFPTPSKWTIDEVEELTYLGLVLDPALFMYKTAEHACQKIIWAHFTIAAVAHNLRHDPPLRHTRSSPLVLFRFWQSCVLPFATQHLGYLNTKTQVQKVQSTLLRSLQCI